MLAEGIEDPALASMDLIQDPTATLLGTKVNFDYLDKFKNTMYLSTYSPELTFTFEPNQKLNAQ